MNIGLDIRVGKRHKKGSASAFDTDVQNWLDLITDKPSAIQNDYVNTMIKDMKEGLGVERMSDWADVFYHLAAETAEASLKNLAKDAHHAVAVNGPVHTPFEGWQGDGISAYIDTNYNTYSDADNYKLNSVAVGIYMRKSPTGTFQYEVSARSASASTTMRVNTSATYTRFGINAVDINLNRITTYGTKLGLYVSNRTTSTEVSISRNKESFQVFDSNSIDLPDVNFKILGEGGSYSHDGQASLFFASGGVIENERDVVYDSFQELMTKNNKEV